MTPVFRWNPVPGITKYEIGFFNDAELTSPVGDFGPYEVSGTMFSPIRALPENQAEDGYFWQVVTCPNGTCPNGFYSTLHRVFNKKSNLVHLLSPEAGATTTHDVITFKW